MTSTRSRTTTKRTTAKRAPAKRAPVKRSPAKKAASSRASQTRSTAKRSTAKKSTAKKATAKKSTVRKPAATKSAPKSPVSTRRARAGNERSGDVVFSIVAIVVVFGSLLGTVVVQTFIVQNRVQLDAINAELSVEREKNQQLRLEVIELEAPKRILDTATSRLGMVRPEQRTYLPGVDPNLVAIELPAPGDPFGPAPLPESLMPTTTTTIAAPPPAAEPEAAEDANTEDASTETTGTEDATEEGQP